MASIQTSIELYDKVSAPAYKITAALDSIVGGYEAVERTMESSLDTKPIEKANKEIDNMTDSIMSAVAAYASFQTVTKLAEVSDEMVKTQSRLNMMNESFNEINGTAYETSELVNLVYQSAQNARGAFGDMAAVVAKFGNNAKDAFSNQEEVVAFANLIQKQMKIAGASTAEASNAMLQLSQALGSGVLRGDELNSIFEQAPNLIQSIADYLDVPIGQIRKMASEGELTADIVKNAIFAASDEINAQFESIPMTWSDVWTDIMNRVYMASMPFLNVINWLANNWAIIEPIALGVVSALAVYLAATKGVELATKAWAAAQGFLNNVMALNPVYLVIMGVMLLIGVLYGVVAAINKVTGSSISATGIIAGAVAAAGAFIWNLFVAIINNIIQTMYATVAPIISIIEWILNAANGGFNSFGDAVANLIGQIISWFLSLGKVVTTIIDAIFGTNWTSGLTSLQNSVLKWGKNEDAITISREAPQLDRISYSDAWNKGYSYGEGLGNEISSFFGGTNGADLFGGGYDVSQIPSNIASMADNTDSIADSMDITSEDLKYLRDLAETEAVNRFTTAEIKIEMTNNNSIASDMDLDGIVDYLANGVNEAMEKAAEGVHN